MAYVRVWIHLIWSTKNREPLMKEEIRGKIFDHIRNNAKDKEIYLDCIDGYLDHVHTPISLRPDQSISKVAQLLKGESSHWVNIQQLTPLKFEWQDEYIAISVSDSAVDTVRNYIMKQEEHHRGKTFAEEYQQFLKKYHFDSEG